MFSLCPVSFAPKEMGRKRVYCTIDNNLRDAEQIEILVLILWTKFLIFQHDMLFTCVALSFAPKEMAQSKIETNNDFGTLHNE